MGILYIVNKSIKNAAAAILLVVVYFSFASNNKNSLILCHYRTVCEASEMLLSVSDLLKVIPISKAIL